MGGNDAGDLTIGKLMDITAGYWQSRALLTAQELGVFAALGKGAATATELAARLRCSERGVQLLANALVGMGLLEKREQHYANGPFAARHFVPGSDGYLGGYLEHHANLWQRWSHLSEAVCEGTAEPAAMPQGAVRSFIMAMHTSSQHWSDRAIERLDLTGVRRVIDVGGGSGDYAYAVLRRAPEATAVIFDLPDVVPITMECAAMAGMTDRIETVAGDYRADELGEGFDLAIVSNILHSLDEDGCVWLLQKVWRCLAPGGRAVVHDFVLSEDRTQPVWAALFALNMLTAGSRGRSYSHGEIARFLLAAHFADVEHIDLEGDTGLVIGRRPGD